MEERWDCEYENARGGYQIIPFDEYYGLYTWMDFLENENFANKVSNRYLTIDGTPSCGIGLAAAIGLPEEAQFSSVEQCKELVAHICCEKVQWINSTYSYG
jgi:hypothetical protein